MRACVRACVRASVRACVCACACMCVHVRACACVHACVRACVRACMYVRTHICPAIVAREEKQEGGSVTCLILVHLPVTAGTTNSAPPTENMTIPYAVGIRSIPIDSASNVGKMDMNPPPAAAKITQPHVRAA